MKLSVSVFWLKVLIHIAALAPVIYNYYLAIHDQLGADPVKAIIHFTGLGALKLLLLTLAVSPCAKHFRIGQLIKLRRLLGLYCFFYAVLHLVSFYLFELQQDLSLLLNEIIDRPYITIGMLAWMLLLLLALTSPMFVRKKMGSMWQRLHNTVYLIAMLVVIHFYWSVKSDIVEPAAYAGILLLLLYMRRDKLIKMWR